MKKLLFSIVAALIFVTGITNTRAAYDPTIGRWETRDPLPNAEKSQGSNLYEYCRNDSIRYSDPDGQQVAVPLPGPFIVITIGLSAWELWNLTHQQTHGGDFCPTKKEHNCQNEWAEARESCAKWLSSPNPPRGLTGGYQDIESCAKGHVSQACGGNAVN